MTPSIDDYRLSGMSSCRFRFLLGLLVADFKGEDAPAFVGPADGDDFGDGRVEGLERFEVEGDGFDGLVVGEKDVEGLELGAVFVRHVVGWGRRVVLGIGREHRFGEICY